MKQILLPFVLCYCSTGLFAQEGGFISLLDRSQESAWRQCGPGGMKIEEGIGTTWTPDGKGVFYGVAWYSARMFGDFVLKAEFRGVRTDYNSGLRLRFPTPGNDPKQVSDLGYEISIVSPSAHSNEADMRNGAIAHTQAPRTPAKIKRAGEWNELEVTVTGQRYLVKINGVLVNDFTGNRGISGYVGIENHKFGPVQWRDVRIQDLSASPPPAIAPAAVPTSPGPASLKDALLAYKWSWTHKNINNELQLPKEVHFLPNGELKTSAGEVWHWRLEGPQAVRVFFEPGVVGIVLVTDASWQSMTWNGGRQAVAATRLSSSPPAAGTIVNIQTDANQPRIEVIKDQGPNATEWALTPLDEAIPSDIRQNLTFLREDLLDEGAKAAKSTPEAYKLASDYCDKLLAALDQRELARVNAGYRAAQADANKATSTQALDARRNHQMSWPQYAREESQRAALRENETNKADVKKERLKVEWATRATQMRSYLDNLYRQLREAMRQPPLRN